VLGDRAEQTVLLVVSEPTELQTEARAKVATTERLLRPRREPTTQRQPAVDPRALASEQPTNGAGAELVVIAQRADHSRLVERRGRACWSIGREQPPLLLGARARRFNQHRHQAMALFTPATQAFEAVEQLVLASRA
jgi:hypothetical protein